MSCVEVYFMAVLCSELFPSISVLVVTGASNNSHMIGSLCKLN
jgi:hypothetical protein